MNEIVKYHNDLSELPLRKFTSAELDLLMTICSRCKYQDTAMLNFTFDDLKKLADYKAKDERQFIKDLANTNKKLLSLNMRLEDENQIVQFVLFTEFTIDKNNRDLQIKINEKFAYILNELTSNFTRFELDEFIQLKSSYAKACYRQLKRYRDTGFWSVSLERFKELMDIPKSYTLTNLDKRILKPIDNELSKVFKKFTIEKKYGSGRGKPVIGFEFYFTSERPWEPVTDPNEKGYKETGFICPDCGQVLVEKVINGSNCWCHIDGYKRNATCRRIFNSVAEIEGYEGDKKKSSEEEKKTHEKRGFFGKLFG